MRKPFNQDAQFEETIRLSIESLKVRDFTAVADHVTGYLQTCDLLGFDVPQAQHDIFNTLAGICSAVEVSDYGVDVVDIARRAGLYVSEQPVVVP